MKAIIFALLTVLVVVVLSAHHPLDPNRNSNILPTDLIDLTYTAPGNNTSDSDFVPPPTSDSESDDPPPLADPPPRVNNAHIFRYSTHFLSRPFSRSSLTLPL